MKLNLVPQTVRTGSRNRTAWVISALLVLGGIGACVLMTIKADSTDAAAQAALAEVQPQAQKAYDTAAAADTITGSAEAKQVVLNTSLAIAMLGHSKDYPDMYEDLFKHNPPFFRWTSISATPVDADTANIVMTGTIQSYQQYADLMLALMNNPKVVAVSRANYNYDAVQVPPLVPIDQVGKPRKPSAAPIPDDALMRLSYFESIPQTPDYQSIGNYGSEGTIERQAKPGDSLITVTMLAKYKLQTPSPLQTLASGGGATTTASTPTGGTAGGGAPGMGGANSLAPANTPSSPPGAGSKPGNRAGAAKGGEGD